MHMATLERRLQLLLDRERYEKVSGEAERSGRSVAAVIRDAIDARYADLDSQARRAAAGRRLLASMEASGDEASYTPDELEDDAAYYDTSWAREMRATDPGPAG